MSQHCTACGDVLEQPGVCESCIREREELDARISQLESALAIAQDTLTILSKGNRSPGVLIRAKDALAEIAKLMTHSV